MSDYRVLTLKSGKSLSVRPLPYTVWEDLENEREAKAEELAFLIEQNSMARASLLNTRILRDKREKKFQACVKDWDKVKTTLDTAEARELDDLMDKLSFPELETENLSVAGDGPANQTA